jgi:hypothetical protein
MFEVEVFTLEKTENDDSVRPIGNKVPVRIRWRHSTAVVPSDDGTVTCNEAEVHMWDDVAKWRLLPAGQWREMLRDSSGLPGDPVSKSVADDTTGASTTSLKVSDAESTSETKPSLESNANDHQHTPDNDRPTPSSDDQIPHEDHPASDNTELAHDKTQPAPTNTWDTSPSSKTSKSGYLLIFLDVLFVPFFLIFLILGILLIWKVSMAGHQGLSEITRLVMDGDLYFSNELVGVIAGLLVLVSPMYYFFLWPIFARSGTQGSWEVLALGSDVCLEAQNSIGEWLSRVRRRGMMFKRVMELHTLEVQVLRKRLSAFRGDISLSRCMCSSLDVLN